MHHPGHLVDGAVEGRLGGLGGPGEAASLSHELQGRGANFARGRGRFEIMQRLDVAAHGNPRYSIKAVTCRVADLPPIINQVDTGPTVPGLVRTMHRNPQQFGTKAVCPQIIIGFLTRGVDPTDQHR